MDAQPTKKKKNEAAHPHIYKNFYKEKGITYFLMSLLDRTKIGQTLWGMFNLDTGEKSFLMLGRVASGVY